VSVALYIGRKGCGKSTLIRSHVYGSRAPVRAFLIVDRDGQGTWDGPVFKSAAQVRKLETIPRFVVFRGASGAEVAELAVDLGSCVYVDEEVHRTIAERPWRPWDPAKDRSKGHPLYAVLHEGRHLANACGEVGPVDALIATHRPANLPSDLPALCDALYLGQLTSYVDAERVFREGWLPEATTVREAREALARRQPGEFSRCL
jgi:hypothetical protein